VETALAMEDAVRDSGAQPATIAVLKGKLTDRHLARRHRVAGRAPAGAGAQDAAAAICRSSSGSAPTAPPPWRAR
jgi:hypothetical protein